MSLLHNFRTVRWIRTANLILQAALFLSLMAGINYIAGNHYWRDNPWRYDLTRYRRYSLSPETLAYLKELQAPVRAIVTMAEDKADPEVRGLLREYSYATEANPDGNGISVQYLDLDLNRREADRLGIDQENAIVLICRGQRRVLQVSQLFQYRDGQRVAFVGEQAITGGILYVSNPERKKIYFLVGHDEMRPDDVDPMNGLSDASGELVEQNYEVATLDLSTAPKVPPDAALLIDVRPRAPFKAQEQELLRHYLSADAGRLILFLAPYYPHPDTGLESLLNDWGVTVDNDILYEKGTANQTPDDDLIIRYFAQHPAVALLDNEKDGLRIGPGGARTVRPNRGEMAGSDLSVVTVAASSRAAWGEIYGAGGRTYAGAVVRPLPGMTPPGRLGIAVASERVAARDNLPFSVPGGRLLVVGTGDLISNAQISNVGALDFLVGAVSWAVKGDTRLAIPVRPIERVQLSLSAAELHNLRFCLLAGLPGLAALLGLIVYWTRRR